jgi:hypothetical protein
VVEGRDGRSIEGNDTWLTVELEGLDDGSAERMVGEDCLEEC